MCIRTIRLVRLLAFVMVVSSFTSSCYFFRKKSPGAATESSGVVGESLGALAGGADEQALEVLYAVATTHAPAGVRPDPDLVVRNLLLEYRDQGSLVAREIGRVENYRLLLGGASQDFTITPQKTYDATSLLAKLKVAEEICEGLVSPDPDDQPGWDSILPGEPNSVSENLLFLSQRLLGVPSTSIQNETLTSLQQILDTAVDEDGAYTNSSYIPVCATLILDAGSLLL